MSRGRVIHDADARGPVLQANRAHVPVRTAHPFPAVTGYVIGNLIILALNLNGVWSGGGLNQQFDAQQRVVLTAADEKGNDLLLQNEAL